VLVANVRHQLFDLFVERQRGKFGHDSGNLRRSSPATHGITTEIDQGAACIDNSDFGSSRTIASGLYIVPFAESAALVFAIVSSTKLNG